MSFSANHAFLQAFRRLMATHSDLKLIKKVYLGTENNRLSIVLVVNHQYKSKLLENIRIIAQIIGTIGDFHRLLIRSGADRFEFFFDELVKFDAEIGEPIEGQYDRALSDWQRLQRQLTNETEPSD